MHNRCKRFIGDFSYIASPSKISSKLCYNDSNELIRKFSVNTNRTRAVFQLHEKV